MIDLHTHLHPPRLFAAIRRWFAERTDWDLTGQPSEPAEVAAVMRQAGVERFVFCSYAHKPGMARAINTWLAQTSRDLDGYGVALATVHLEDPDTVGDIRAALDDGCIGLKLHEDVQRVPIDDPRLEPVFAELARRGAFVLAHVGPIPWTYPERIGLTRVERVLATHPTLNVVVAHMGAPDTRAYFALMERYPRLYLDTTMLFARVSPMHGELDADAALLTRHAARVIYGTDFPNIPYAYTQERDGISSMGLPEAALRAILHENAATLIAEASRA